MKKIKILIIFLMIFTLNVAGFCTDDDDTSKNFYENLFLKSIYLNQWKITNLNVDNSNKTNLYTDYGFNFINDNSIIANKSNLNNYGTWYVLDEDTSIDTIEDLKFQINFDTPASFNFLNKSWNIVTHTDTLLEFNNLNANGGTDVLIFQKN